MVRLEGDTVADATTGGMMVPVSEVRVGDRLFAPDTFPNGLWCEVLEVREAAVPGSVAFHGVEDTDAGRTANNQAVVTLKLNGTARVRRPPATPTPEPTAA